MPFSRWLTADLTESEAQRTRLEEWKRDVMRRLEALEADVDVLQVERQAYGRRASDYS